LIQGAATGASVKFIHEISLATERENLWLCIEIVVGLVIYCTGRYESIPCMLGLLRRAWFGWGVLCREFSIALHWGRVGCWWSHWVCFKVSLLQLLDYKYIKIA
jgi:hypothetical protein